MSFDYIFPEHVARKRHLAIGLEITGALLAVIIIGWAAFHQQPSQTPVSTAPVEDPAIAARRALLEQPNPTITLTPSEIAARAKLLSQTNPTVKLTKEQIEARKVALESI